MNITRSAAGYGSPSRDVIDIRQLCVLPRRSTCWTACPRRKSLPLANAALAYIVFRSTYSTSLAFAGSRWLPRSAPTMLNHQRTCTTTCVSAIRVAPHGRANTAHVMRLRWLGYRARCAVFHRRKAAVPRLAERSIHKTRRSSEGTVLHTSTLANVASSGMYCNVSWFSSVLHGSHWTLHARMDLADLSLASVGVAAEKCHCQQPLHALCCSGSAVHTCGGEYKEPVVAA